MEKNFAFDDSQVLWDESPVQAGVQDDVIWDESPGEVQPETWGQFGARQAARTGVSAISSAGLPGAVAGIVKEATGIGAAQRKGIEAQREAMQYMPEWARERMQETIQHYEKPGILESPERIKETIGEFLPEDYLKPQNRLERIADRIAFEAPANLLMPGGFLGNSMRSFVSGASVETADAMGYGPTGQMVAGLAGAVGYDLWRHALKRVPKGFGVKGGMPKKVKTIERKIEDVSSNLYNEVKESGKNLPIETRGIRASSTKVGKKYLGPNSSLTESSASEVKRQLNSVKKIIRKNPKVSGIIEKKQAINKIISKIHDTDAKAALNELNDSLREAIQDSAQQYPELIKTFNQAENITTALKRADEVDDMIKSFRHLFKNIPILKYLNFIPYTITGVVKNVARPDLIDLAYHVPEARIILREIMTNALYGDQAAMARNIKMLSDMTQSS